MLTNEQPLTTLELRDRLVRRRVPFHAGADGEGTFVVRRALSALYTRGLVACHSIPDWRGNVRTGARTYVYCLNDDVGLAAMGRSFGGLGEPFRRRRPSAS